VPFVRRKNSWKNLGAELDLQPASPYGMSFWASRNYNPAGGGRPTAFLSSFKRVNRSSLHPFFEVDFLNQVKGALFSTTFADLGLTTAHLGSHFATTLAFKLTFESENPWHELKPGHR